MYPCSDAVQGRVPEQAPVPGPNGMPLGSATVGTGGVVLVGDATTVGDGNVNTGHGMI